MKLEDLLLLNNHVIFYPFSGADFGLINLIKDKDETKNALYIYCTIATREEHDLGNFPGCFDTIDFLENKMGLSKLKISNVVKLDNVFDARYYEFESGVKLVFVKYDVFSFMSYLRFINAPLSNFNTVFKLCGSTNNIIPIVRDIHNPADTINQFIIVDDIFLNDVKCHFESIDNPTRSYLNIEDFDHNLFILKTANYSRPDIEEGIDWITIKRTI